MTTPTGGRSFIDDAADIYNRLRTTADRMMQNPDAADLELVTTLQDAADVLREILPDNADQCEHVYCYRDWSYVASDLGADDIAPVGRISRICAVHAADVAPFVRLVPRKAATCD